MTEKRRGFFRRPRTPEAFPNFGPGKCLFCGLELPPKRRKYCCNTHGIEYKIATRKYDIVAWSEIREEAFRRDNWTCQDCHTQFPEHSEVLEGHHIVPIFAGGAEFDLDNVVTLCCQCHAKRRGKEMLYATNKKIEDYSGGT